MNSKEVEINIMRTLRDVCAVSSSSSPTTIISPLRGGDQQQQTFLDNNNDKERHYRILRDLYDSLSRFITSETNHTNNNNNNTNNNNKSSLLAATELFCNKLLKFAEFLVDHGQYEFALESPLLEMEDSLVMLNNNNHNNNNKSSSSSSFIIQMRYLSLIHVATFFRVLHVDERLERRASFDSCINSATKLTNVGIECLKSSASSTHHFSSHQNSNNNNNNNSSSTTSSNPDSFYFIIFNITVYLTRCCLALMHRGYYQQSTSFLAWACRACDSVIQLATTRYLHWRVRLYSLLALCFENVGDVVAALTIAKQLQLRVSELAALESLDIVPPSVEQKKALDEAQQQSSLLVVQYSMMVANVHAGCVVNPTAAAAAVSTSGSNNINNNNNTFSSPSSPPSTSTAAEDDIQDSSSIKQLIISAEEAAIRKSEQEAQLNSNNKDHQQKGNKSAATNKSSTSISNNTNRKNADDHHHHDGDNNNAENEHEADPNQQLEQYLKNPLSATENFNATTLTPLELLDRLRAIIIASKQPNEIHLNNCDREEALRQTEASRVYFTELVTALTRLAAASSSSSTKNNKTTTDDEKKTTASTTTPTTQLQQSVATALAAALDFYCDSYVVRFQRKQRKQQQQQQQASSSTTPLPAFVYKSALLPDRDASSSNAGRDDDDDNSNSDGDHGSERGSNDGDNNSRHSSDMDNRSDSDEFGGKRNKRGGGGTHRSSNTRNSSSNRNNNATNKNNKSNKTAARNNKTAISASSGNNAANNKKLTAAQQQAILLQQQQEAAAMEDPIDSLFEIFSFDKCCSLTKLMKYTNNKNMNNNNSNVNPENDDDEADPEEQLVPLSTIILALRYFSEQSDAVILPDIQKTGNAHTRCHNVMERLSAICVHRCCNNNNNNNTTTASTRHHTRALAQLLATFRKTRFCTSPSSSPLSLNNNNNNNSSSSQTTMMISLLAQTLDSSLSVFEQYPIPLVPSQTASGAVSGLAWSADVVQDVALFLWKQYSSASNNNNNNDNNNSNSSTFITRPIVRALVFVNHPDALLVALIALTAFGSEAVPSLLEQFSSSPSAFSTVEDFDSAESLNTSIRVVEAALRFVSNRQASYLISMNSSSSTNNNNNDQQQHQKPQLWFRELRDARTELWRVLCRLIIRRSVYKKFRASFKDHQARLDALYSRQTNINVFGRPTLKQQAILHSAEEQAPELVAVATDVTSDPATVSLLCNHGSCVSELFKTVAITELAANALTVPTQHKLFNAAHVLLASTVPASSFQSVVELDDHFSTTATDASPVLLAAHLLKALSLTYTPTKSFSFDKQFQFAINLCEKAFFVTPAQQHEDDQFIVSGVEKSKRLSVNQAFALRSSAILLRTGIDALVGWSSMALHHCDVNETTALGASDDTGLGGELDEDRAVLEHSQAIALGALERCAVASSICVASNDAQRCIRTVFIAARCVSAVTKFGSDKALPLLRSIPCLIRSLTDLVPASSSSSSSPASPWSDDGLQLVTCRLLCSYFETIQQHLPDSTRKTTLQKHFFPLFIRVWNSILVNPSYAVSRHMRELKTVAVGARNALFGRPSDSLVSNTANNQQSNDGSATMTSKKGSTPRESSNTKTSTSKSSSSTSKQQQQAQAQAQQNQQQSNKDFETRASSLLSSSFSGQNNNNNSYEIELPLVHQVPLEWFALLESIVFGPATLSSSCDDILLSCLIQEVTSDLSKATPSMFQQKQQLRVLVSVACALRRSSALSIHNNNPSSAFDGNSNNKGNYSASSSPSVNLNGGAAPPSITIVDTVPTSFSNNNNAQQQEQQSSNATSSKQRNTSSSTVTTNSTTNIQNISSSSTTINIDPATSASFLFSAPIELSIWDPLFPWLATIIVEDCLRKGLYEFGSLFAQQALQGLSARYNTLRAVETESFASLAQVIEHYEQTVLLADIFGTTTANNNNNALPSSDGENPSSTANPAFILTAAELRTLPPNKRAIITLNRHIPVLRRRAVFHSLRALQRMNDSPCQGRLHELQGAILAQMFPAAPLHVQATLPTAQNQALALQLQQQHAQNTNNNSNASPSSARTGISVSNASPGAQTNTLTINTSFTGGGATMTTNNNTNITGGADGAASSNNIPNNGANNFASASSLPTDATSALVLRIVTEYTKAAVILGRNNNCWSRALAITQSLISLIQRIYKISSPPNLSMLLGKNSTGGTNNDGTASAYSGFSGGRRSTTQRGSRADSVFTTDSNFGGGNNNNFGGNDRGMNSIGDILSNLLGHQGGANLPSLLANLEGRMKVLASTVLLRCLDVLERGLYGTHTNRQNSSKSSSSSNADQQQQNHNIDWLYAPNFRRFNLDRDVIDNNTENNNNNSYEDDSNNNNNQQQQQLCIDNLIYLAHSCSLISRNSSALSQKMQIIDQQREMLASNSLLRAKAYELVTAEEAARDAIIDEQYQFILDDESCPQILSVEFKHDLREEIQEEKDEKLHLQEQRKQMNRFSSKYNNKRSSGGAGGNSSARSAASSIGAGSILRLVEPDGGEALKIREPSVGSGGVLVMESHGLSVREIIFNIKFACEVMQFHKKKLSAISILTEANSRTGNRFARHLLPTACALCKTTNQSALAQQLTQELLVFEKDEPRLIKFVEDARYAWRRYETCSEVYKKIVEVNFFNEWAPGSQNRLVSSLPIGYPVQAIHAAGNNPMNQQSNSANANNRDGGDSRSATVTPGDDRPISPAETNNYASESPGSLSGLSSPLDNNNNQQSFIDYQRQQQQQLLQLVGPNAVSTQLKPIINLYQQAIEFLRAKQKRQRASELLFELGIIFFRHSMVDDAKQAWNESADACLGHVNSLTKFRSLLKSENHSDLFSGVGFWKALCASGSLSSLAKNVLLPANESSALDACLLIAEMLRSFNDSSVAFPDDALDILRYRGATASSNQRRSQLFSGLVLNSPEILSASDEGSASNLVVHIADGLVFAACFLLEQHRPIHAAVVAKCAEALALDAVRSVPLVVVARTVLCRAAACCGDFNSAFAYLADITRGGGLPTTNATDALLGSASSSACSWTRDVLSSSPMSPQLVNAMGQGNNKLIQELNTILTTQQELANQQQQASSSSNANNTQQQQQHSSSKANKSDSKSGGANANNALFSTNALPNLPVFITNTNASASNEKSGGKGADNNKSSAFGGKNNKDGAAGLLGDSSLLTVPSTASPSSASYPTGYSPSTFGSNNGFSFDAMMNFSVQESNNDQEQESLPENSAIVINSLRAIDQLCSILGFSSNFAAVVAKNIQAAQKLVKSQLEQQKDSTIAPSSPTTTSNNNNNNQSATSSAPSFLTPEILPSIVLQQVFESNEKGSKGNKSSTSQQQNDRRNNRDSNNNKDNNDNAGTDYQNSNMNTLESIPLQQPACLPEPVVQEYGLDLSQFVIRSIVEMLISTVQCSPVGSVWGDSGMYLKHVLGGDDGSEDNSSGGGRGGKASGGGGKSSSSENQQQNNNASSAGYTPANSIPFYPASKQKNSSSSSSPLDDFFSANPAASSSTSSSSSSSSPLPLAVSMLAEKLISHLGLPFNEDLTSATGICPQQALVQQQASSSSGNQGKEKGLKKESSKGNLKDLLLGKDEGDNNNNHTDSDADQWADQVVQQKDEPEISLRNPTKEDPRSAVWLRLNAARLARARGFFNKSRQLLQTAIEIHAVPSSELPLDKPFFPSILYSVRPMHVLSCYIELAQILNLTHRPVAAQEVIEDGLKLAGSSALPSASNSNNNNTNNKSVFGRVNNLLASAHLQVALAQCHQQTGSRQHLRDALQDAISTFRSVEYKNSCGGEADSAIWEAELIGLPEYGFDDEKSNSGKTSSASPSSPLLVLVKLILRYAACRGTGLLLRFLNQRRVPYNLSSNNFSACSGASHSSMIRALLKLATKMVKKSNDLPEARQLLNWIDSCTVVDNTSSDNNTSSASVVTNLFSSPLNLHPTLLHELRIARLENIRLIITSGVGNNASSSSSTSPLIEEAKLLVASIWKGELSSSHNFTILSKCLSNYALILGKNLMTIVDNNQQQQRAQQYRELSSILSWLNVVSECEKKLYQVADFSAGAGLPPQLPKNTLNGSLINNSTISNFSTLASWMFECSSNSTSASEPSIPLFVAESIDEEIRKNQNAQTLFTTSILNTAVHNASNCVIANNNNNNTSSAFNSSILGGKGGGDKSMRGGNNNPSSNKEGGGGSKGNASSAGNAAAFGYGVVPPGTQTVESIIANTANNSSTQQASTGGFSSLLSSTGKVPTIALVQLFALLHRSTSSCLGSDQRAHVDVGMSCIRQILIARCRGAGVDPKKTLGFLEYDYNCTTNKTEEGSSSSSSPALFNFVPFVSSNTTISSTSQQQQKQSDNSTTTTTDFVKSTLAELLPSTTSSIFVASAPTPNRQIAELLIFIDPTREEEIEQLLNEVDSSYSIRNEGGNNQNEDASHNNTTTTGKGTNKAPRSSSNKEKHSANKQRRNSKQQDELGDATSTTTAALADAQKLKQQRIRQKLIDYSQDRAPFIRVVQCDVSVVAEALDELKESIQNFEHQQQKLKSLSSNKHQDVNNIINNEDPLVQALREGQIALDGGMSNHHHDHHQKGAGSSNTKSSNSNSAPTSARGGKRGKRGGEEDNNNNKTDESDSEEEKLRRQQKPTNFKNSFVAALSCIFAGAKRAAARVAAASMPSLEVTSERGDFFRAAFSSQQSISCFVSTSNTTKQTQQKENVENVANWFYNVLTAPPPSMNTTLTMMKTEQQQQQQQQPKPLSPTKPKFPPKSNGRNQQQVMADDEEF